MLRIFRKSSPSLSHLFAQLRFLWYVRTCPRLELGRPENQWDLAGVVGTDIRRKRSIVPYTCGS